MREIKFRGRSCDKWLYGSLHVNESGQPAISTPAHFVFRCVAPETLGQYTGLKDSEGREIYEGDVIEIEKSVARAFELKTPAVVEYSNGAFIATRDNSYSSLKLLYVLTYADDITRIRANVIGNIHDNPELLMEAPK